MSVRYVVRRGDCLWGLAGRYLGDFTKWPDIRDHHNEQVQKLGQTRNGLFAITNPNLIYVGQVLIIPGRGERRSASAANATKAEAGTIATPVDLKVEYTIGPPRPCPQPAPKPATAGRASGKFAVPIDLKAEQSPKATLKYGPYSTPDYTMTGELAGKIVLQNMNPDRHRRNFELAISGNENILRQKLKEQYDQAFLELTADMGMQFDPATGMASVRPRIAAKAGMGPYTFKVQAESPTHFSSIVDLNPIEGSFDLAGRKFKYGSKLSLKVDITLHPTPKGAPVTKPKAVAVRTNQTKSVSNTGNYSTSSAHGLKKVALGTAIIAIVYLIITRGGSVITQIGKSMNPAMQKCPAFRSPFIYTIDYNDPSRNA